MYSFKNNDPYPLTTSSLQDINTFMVIITFFFSVIFIS